MKGLRKITENLQAGFPLSGKYSKPRPSKYYAEILTNI
jgi:hypothetical protein